MLQAWLVSWLCVWGILGILPLITTSPVYGEREITALAAEAYDQATPGSAAQVLAAREILKQAEELADRPDTGAEAVGARLASLVTFGIGATEREKRRETPPLVLPALYLAGLVGAPIVARRKGRRIAVWIALGLIPIGLPALFAVALAERPLVE
jgi:hypothetical protein